MIDNAIVFTLNMKVEMSERRNKKVIYQIYMNKKLDMWFFKNTEYILCL